MPACEIVAILATVAVAAVGGGESVHPVFLQAKIAQRMHLPDHIKREGPSFATGHPPI